jgi:hypothetical protein
METNNLKWSEERLQKVLKTIDLVGYYVTFENGSLRITGRSTEKCEEIKKLIIQGYSAQVLKDASKKFGFVIKKQTKTTNGLTQLHMGRV